jgi:sugar phosphate isomerase/epimerase
MSDIGVSTGAYAALPLGAALLRIAEVASFAEICSWGRHSLTDPENARAVREVGLPFTVHGPMVHDGVGGTFWGRHRAVRDMHRRHMTAAAELGAILYVVHPDSHVRQRLNNPAAAAAFGHALEELRTLQQQTGVRVVVENLPFSWLSRFTNPTDMDLEGLGFALDVGHAAIEGLLRLWLTVPQSSLNHMHLHDNHGHNSGDEHLALGQGVIDVAPAMAAARAAGATIVLEHKREADVLASLEHLRARGLLPAQAAPEVVIASESSVVSRAALAVPEAARRAGLGAAGSEAQLEVIAQFAADDGSRVSDEAAFMEEELSERG